MLFLIRNHTQVAGLCSQYRRWVVVWERLKAERWRKMWGWHSSTERTDRGTNSTFCCL